MKTTIGQLINSLGNTDTGEVGAFYRFNQQTLPIKTAMQMKAIIRRVEEIVTDFNATRLEFCERHGTLNEQTGNFDFTHEQGMEFNKDMAELAATEIELPGQRLKVSQLLSSTVITPNDALKLEWLLDDSRAAETAKDEETPDPISRAAKAGD